MTISVKLSELIAPVFFDVHKDIQRHGHTHYDLSGGRGSTKSSLVSLEVILLIVKNPDTHAIVFRRYGNTLRTSVYAQYLWAIGKLHLERYFTAHTSPMELIYKPTGQKIMFFGLDDEFKFKSIKLPFGYIGITHFEEKDQFAGRQQIRTVLQSTQRGGERFWNFESYNPPISAASWANKDSLEERPDRYCHSSTYLDIPADWLGSQFIAEAEHLRDTNPSAYEHEYLGKITGTGGNVFENADFCEITDEEIAQFDRIYMGVDWGWYPDPFAYIKCHYDSARKVLYLLDEYGCNKQSNDQTAAALRARGVTDNDIITADSAEEKSIADYRSYGLFCRPAEKGPGSVAYSMKWLQSLSKIVIDRKRCPKAATEFAEYEYERTKSGEILNSYPDKDNHFIDAVRYALNPIWRRKGM